MKEREYTKDHVGDFMKFASDSNTPYKVLDEIKDGSAWSISGDYIIIDNPDFGEDNGKDPRIVCSLDDMLHLLIYIQLSNEQQQEQTETILDDVTRLEKTNQEREVEMEKLAAAVANLPYLLPFKYQPSWLKRDK